RRAEGRAPRRRTQKSHRPIPPIPSLAPQAWLAPPEGRGEKAVVRPPLVNNVARDDLPALLRGPGALDGGAAGLDQEMHRAIAEEPVPAACVHAPVVVPVAGVVDVPGPEPLRASGAGLFELVLVGAPLRRVGQAHGAVNLDVGPVAAIRR